MTLRVMVLSSFGSIHGRRWVEALRARGVEVVAAAFPGEAPVVADVTPLEIPRDGAPGVRALAAVRAIRRIAQQTRPHLVHAHGLGLYALYATMARVSPLVVTPWGSDLLLDLDKSRAHRFLMRGVLRQARAVHSVSDVSTERLLGLGVRADRIFQSPQLGIDTNAFSPAAPPTFGADPARVVSTRNFEPVYDVQTLIEAFPRVLVNVPDASLLLVGEGTLRAQLESRVEALGLSQRVRFLGRVPNDALPGVLTSARVYVSTAVSDSLGISNLEGMACGLTPVTVDLPATREWIEDGVTGRLVPPRSPMALAAAITDALRARGVAPDAGARARARVLEGADTARITERVIAWYEAIATGRA